jgi:hypothetical protein
MYTKDRDDFIEAIIKYKKSEDQLFYFIRWFEEKLIREKIKI